MATVPQSDPATAPVGPGDDRRAQMYPVLSDSQIDALRAAGDVRANSTKRVASAVGEGSVVVQYVHRVLA